MTASEARKITDLAKAKETWVDCIYSKIQNDIKIAANFGSGGVSTVIDTFDADTDKDVDTVAAKLVLDGFGVSVVFKKGTDEALFKVSW